MWYCHHRDLGSSNEKCNQDNTLYDLLEHLFLLGRTPAEGIVKILTQLEKNYFLSLEEKMQLLLNVRLFIDWTIERSHLPDLYFLKTILKWCYLNYK